MQKISPSDFDALARVFPAQLDEVLRRHKVVTKRRGAKLKTSEQFMRMLLLHVGCDLALRQTAAVLKKAEILDISPMRIHKNLAKAPEALAELVSMMVSAPNQDGERWGGYDVTLVDGSVVVSPGPTSPGGRLHIRQRLSTLEIVESRISATYEMGETLRNFRFSPEELVIGDRAYSTPVGIVNVVGQGADVLVRVNRGSLPLYDSTHSKIDIRKWVCGSCKGTRATSRPATVLGGRGCLPERKSQTAYFLLQRPMVRLEGGVPTIRKLQTPRSHGATEPLWAPGRAGMLDPELEQGASRLRRAATDRHPFLTSGGVL